MVAEFQNFIDTDGDVKGLSKVDFASKEELLRRDKTATKLLQTAMEHINTYDSLETASKIISQAIKLTTSYVVINNLKKAKKNLLGAHKSQRVRFKKHYTKAQKDTIRKNSIDAALEYISEALVNLKIEEDKRTGNLFDNLTTRANVDLPIKVKNPKAKYLVREAPVVVSTTKGEPEGVKSNRLETKLYLIYNASFIGVCVNNMHRGVSPIDFANKKSIEKFGASVYPEPIHRPSDGLNWYLVLNFEAGINYAAFPDYVRASYATESVEEGSTYSYEDYVKGVLAKEAIDSAMKANRLKTIREAFEADNKELYDQISAHKKFISYKQDQIEALKETFAKLTSLEDGESDGLKANQYGQFDKRFSRISYENYIDSELAFLKLRKDLTAQRLEAREIYYTIKMLLEEILELNKKIKALTEQLNVLKRKEAAKHGMIGIRPVEELEDA